MIQTYLELLQWARYNTISNINTLILNIRYILMNFHKHLDTQSTVCNNYLIFVYSSREIHHRYQRVDFPYDNTYKNLNSNLIESLIYAFFCISLIIIQSLYKYTHVHQR